MKKGQILENISIEKLVFWGKGFTRLEDNKVCFITGGAVPWAIVNIKIIKKRRDYYEAQIVSVVQKSPIETENYEEFPWAPWINIDYVEQLKIKDSQVKEALFHLGKYQENINFLPIIAMENTFGYRNKIEFSFGKYISHKEDVFQEFNIGFHKRWEFSKVLDFESCLLIDDIQNDIYSRVREYTYKSWLPVYDQKFWTGFWRHFMMRRMHFSGETLLVFSLNPKYFLEDESLWDIQERTNILEQHLSSLKSFVEKLAHDFPTISSVYFSLNINKSDTLIGDMQLVYGTGVIREELLGYSFDIGPKSFFQTNSQWAEILYSRVKDFSKKKTLWTVLDLYAGTGTIGMTFSDISEKVISVELVEEASKNGALNAEKNKIHNMNFVNAKVEEFLEEYLKNWETADLLIIDPPRAGMHPNALPNILKFQTDQIIYVSCNPATLARDLEYVLANSDYMIEAVQAVDMFPHTHHIETIVSLIKK